MKHHTILLLAFLLFCQYAFTQQEENLKDLFLYAESEFLFEQYAEALPNYLRINKQNPDNDNINFKIGVCYLNDPYEKDKAIAFLEKAVKNINPKFKENSFKETGAPLEAYYYLGNAYRINDQLEKAIDTYEYFKNQADPERYDLELVNKQIMDCKNALDLKTRPVDFNIENLGDRINTRFSDVQPVISGDETRLVYVQKQAFYDALAYSEKIEGEWSFPRILMEELQVDEDVYPTSLSYDGKTLFIYRNDNFTGNLYTSSYVNGKWSPLTKLNEHINTKYWESHASLNKAGDTLYFTSNRKEGYGGLDIYYSVKGSNHDWGRAVNLGATVNTPYNEETPFITADGKTLYFSSYGHYNMGGYDVFYTTKLSDSTWAVPINAGYPINTTDDDVFFNPVHNGTFAYYPRYLEGGLGLMDIYRLEIFSKTHPRKFLVTGMVTREDHLDTRIRVSVIEKYSRDTVAVTYADSATGAFAFTAAAGTYDLLVEGEGYEPATRSLEIPKDYLDKELALTSAILLTRSRELMEMQPKIVDKIQVSDTLIYVDSDEPIEIPMTLERNSVLDVDIYHDGRLNRFETHTIKRRRFVYTYVPVPGENLLRFKLTDREGNLSYKDVRVIYTPRAAALSEQQGQAAAATAIASGTPSEDELEAYRKRLAENAHGDLETVLQDLVLAAAGITSVNQLVNYLKGQAATHDYTEANVDRLIVITPFDELEWTRHLHQNMIAAADGDLKRVLEDLSLDEEGISTEKELISYLKSQASDHDYTTQDVDDLILKLVQIRYMEDYLEQLIDICPDENLQRALVDIDIYHAGPYTLEALYEHMLNQSGTYGYEAASVHRLFAELAQHQDLQELIDHLTASSSGDLQVLLLGLQPGAAGIENGADLMKYLIEASDKYDFTPADVLRPTLDHIGKKDLQEIIDILISISWGDLKDVLTSLDLERDGIDDLADLFYYLLDEASSHDYTEHDVIKLFLDLLKILENKALADEFTATIDWEAERGGGGYWYFWVLGGVLLLAVIIFLAWRWKKSRESQQVA